MTKTIRMVKSYSFSKTMREVIGRSQYWGRLKAYVICSFQSKYALALY
jgi:hypothetical protein